jgi:uncharacterized protein
VVFVKSKDLEMVAWVLVVVGAVNWGLVGLGGLLGMGGWNVVMMVLGSMPMLENLVYLLVGLSGLWLLFKRFGK